MFDTVLGLAVNNLLSPIIMFFVLGIAAALAKSDLSIPAAAAKALSLYLLVAIGFKGGASINNHGVDATMIMSLIAGVILSFLLPLLAFGLLRVMTRLSVTDAAAVAAHYGSISIVTFVAADSLLQSAGIFGESYMVAVAAIMEAPAILSALWIVARYSPNGLAKKREEASEGVLREVLLNGSIVLLVGSFVIGILSGEAGFNRIESFIVGPFEGVLCLFLLDMGLTAGRGLRNSARQIELPLLGFGILMPLVGATVGLLAAALIGLSPGGAFLLMTLCGSASYVAVPAAMRVALPEANPAIYLTVALGITFPFNLTIGVPLYLGVVSALNM